ncbi:MAG: hypothetical protein SH818_01435 [Saprospiraceae bacterium]|nr:hypothetical protein [Saprospiraceae bacterium]
MRTTLITLFAVAVFATTAFTPINEWKIIGERAVKFSSDRDVINVGGNDWYTKLKIKVVDAPLHISNFDVIFENGERFDVAIREDIRKGGESRIIDLPGKERRIDRIEFRYRTTGKLRGGTANVIVFGRR